MGTLRLTTLSRRVREGKLEAAGRIRAERDATVWRRRHLDIVASVLVYSLRLHSLHLRVGVL